MNPLQTNKEYITAEEAASIIGISVRAIRKSKEKYEYKTKPAKGSNGFRLLFKTESVISKLDGEKRSQLIDRLKPEDIAEKTFQEEELNTYALLKPFERDFVDFYLPLIKASEGLTVHELDKFLEAEKDKCKRGKFRTGLSRGNFYKIKAKYKKYGLKGIVPGYGQQEGSTIIDEEDFETFKRLYLQEKGPTVTACWLATKGERIRKDIGVIPENYPSAATFKRLLEKRVPVSAIYLARYGKQKWYRKFGSYHERDYTGIKPGTVWVGDHMQCNTAVISILPKTIRIDVEKLVKYDRANKPVYPWLTVWRCFLTGKWMGVSKHAEAPNSDHIFESFVDGVENHGCPEAIIIDNGKDYRVKDFSGGRTKKVKVAVDEVKTRSMMSMLGIEVHFALPYNPQTKPIEVDFGKFQNWLDQGIPGYRGRNTADRPEALVEQIKRCEILDIAEYFEMVDYFVTNVFNEYVSNGKNNLGKSRNEAYAEGFEGLKRVSSDALKLFCARVSDEYMIGRNGITVDQKFKIYYYAPWMIPLKRTKVYLRRHPNKYQEAYVFRSDNDEYLGKAHLNLFDSHALAKTDLQKQQLQNVTKMIQRERKMVKEMASYERVDAWRYVENLAAGSASNSNEKLQNKLLNS